MKKSFLVPLFCILVSLALSVFVPQHAHAVGVSPGIVEMDGLANGLRVPKNMYVSRPRNGPDVTFSVEISGEGARYIELSSPSFVMKSGQTQVGYTFYIVPKNAPNGLHEAQITFLSQSLGTGAGKTGSMAAVQIGAAAKIRFTVTDREVKGFEILNVSIVDTEEGQPLYVAFQIRNTGNVDFRPDKIYVELKDRTDEGNVIRTEVSGEDVEVVPPLETREITIPFKADIPIGKYKVKVLLFSDNEQKYAVQDLNLQVFPENTLQQSADITINTINGDLFEPNDIVKFSGEISNTGAVTIEPIYIVELQKDGKLVEILRSDTKAVYKGRHAAYALTYRPEKKGAYIAEAYFEYGIRQSEKKQFPFTVASKAIVSSYAAVGIAIIITIALAIGAAVMMKKRNKK